MLHKRSEKGQALVMIALAAVGLFAFTALSVDGGMVFSDKRHAQNAADTAALAAALARVRAQTGPDAAAISAGIARASSNGYDNDVDSAVEVNICNEPGIVCEALPVNANKSEYIRVKIVSTIPLTFARIIGRTSFTNQVTAVAKAKLGGPSPIFDGAALVALAPSGSKTITFQGNPNLDINNSGVFDNSSSACAFDYGGNITVNADTGYTVASGGTSCANGNAMQGNITNSSMFQSGTQIPYPPKFDFPDPSISCSGTGKITADGTAGHYTVHPGSYTNLDLKNGVFTLVNGSYCVSNGISISPGTLVTANYVDILLTGGEFKVQGSFNCDYFLLHSKGGSGYTTNATSSVVCTNATFFMSTGKFYAEGTGAGTYTAPQTGFHPEYANLLVYLPYGNTSPLKITGNSGSEITGSIIGVSAPVEIHGNTNSEVNSSIVGYTVTVTGNATTTINYIPDDQVIEIDPNSIGLTK